MESSVPNELRTVRADSHVLRIDKLACNIPVDNGPHLPRPYQHREGLCLHRRHHNPYKTLEEHRRITKEVLEILRTHKLYIKPEKCEIEKERIEYLGVVVSERKVEMDPVKTEVLTSWPTPKKLKELQSFLGFCNFYRRFIKDYSKIAKPLNQLTGKEEWKWGTQQQTAFDTLRRVITEQPVLVIPVDDEPYRVEADSSDFALGTVLSQRQNDKWHPIAYLSKSLTEAE